MNKLKYIAPTLFLIALLSALAAAQPKASKTTPAKAEFVSVQGGFSISLPPDFEDNSPIDAVEGVSRGGEQYMWQQPEGLFMVGVIDLLSDENPQQAIDAAADRLVEKMTGQGGQLISRKNIPFKEGKALEVRMRLKEAAVAIARYYLAKKRLYVLSSGWKVGENGQTQLKVLDTFKLIDAKALIAKKIAETVPKPLPQAPAVKKLKSDAEDDNLRGKVKTVTEESEDLSGTWEVQGRHLNSVIDYNGAGNRVKSLLYDSKALPYEVVVYGYLDGMRVRNSEDIDFNDSPRLYSIGLGAGNRPKPPKAPDPRYDYSFEYKYTDGKLSEEKWIGNDGSLWLTYVYNYKDKQMEELVYDENGKINQKYLSILDEKGNEIERTNFNVLNQTGDTKYSIKYESFDEKGNWTKKVTYEVVVENGKQTLKPLYADYRTITYYL